MESKKKIIVAHPGKQHSFRLATALKKKGILFKYLTTVYYKQDSRMLPLINKILNGKFFNSIKSRKCEFLDDEDVQQYYSLFSLVTLLLVRLNNGGRIYHLWNNLVTDMFGRRVAKYAIKNKVDVVIMYDTTADVCFKILKKKAPHIRLVIDSSAACNEYVIRTFERDIKKFPDGSLKKEAAIFWNKKMRRQLKRERENADVYLVPSTYCKKSLLQYINCEKKIYIIPYGSNFEIHHKKHFFHNNVINFLFVGQVGYRKGAHYLLEAFSKLQKEKVHLNLIGMYDKSGKIYNKYKNCSNISFAGFVEHAHIMDYYKQADVMIIPTLSEGMTLAGIEGLSFGLPLICTENSGVNDFIVNEENGIVIPSQSENAIINAVQWFINNTDKINCMSNNACESAKKNSWERYYSDMAKVFDEQI